MTRRASNAKTVQWADKNGRIGLLNRTARKYNKSWEVKDEREMRHVYWRSMEEATKELENFTKDLREWSIDLITYSEDGSEIAALQVDGWRDATPDEITRIENAIDKEEAIAAQRAARKREEDEATLERLRHERPELFQKNPLED